MESKSEYLQSKVNDRREDFLKGFSLQELLDMFDVETEAKEVAIETIIEKGLDTHEFGDNYWSRR